MATRPDEPDERDEQYRREEGARTATRDRALGRLDDAEIKSRMVEAFDRFVREGFAVHLIGVRARAATEFRLALYPDGSSAAPVEQIQALADDFRLDFVIEKAEGTDAGWMVVLYPRWSPPA